MTPASGQEMEIEEKDKEEKNRRGGGGKAEGESAMSALHQKLTQSLSTTNQPHPTHPMPHTPLLLNSHINSTSLNCQPGVSSTECQSSVKADRREERERGHAQRGGGRGWEEETAFLRSEAFFYLKVLLNMTCSLPF